MNNALDSSMLSLVTLIPLAGALLLLVFPRRDRDIRVFALVVSLLEFVFSLHLPVHFQRAQTGFQYEVNNPWISNPNIHYHLGVDGISMWLVVLTTFLTPLCVLISWKSISERVKEFFILLLVMETALIGVFVALDLFLFYFFWEATLIPMALLIGMYGHGRRVYAAVKFFLYTMIASMFMLAAILWLYAKTGTFDFTAIQLAIQSGQVENFAGAATWLFLGFFIAFVVKVPIFPFRIPGSSTGCARRSSYSGLGSAGGGAAEDGNVRNVAIQSRPVSGTVAEQCSLDHGAGADRNYLRRTGSDGAAQHEKADRIFINQPFGLCGAWHFQLHAGRTQWRDLRDAGPRSFYGRTVHAGRNSLRTAAHL